MKKKRFTSLVVVLMIVTMVCGSVAFAGDDGEKKQGRISKWVHGDWEKKAKITQKTQNVQQVVNVQTAPVAVKPKPVIPPKSDYDLQWDVLEGYHGLQSDVIDAQGANEVSHSRVSFYKRQIGAMKSEIARHKKDLSKAQGLLLANPEGSSFRVGSRVYSRAILASDINYRLKKVGDLNKSLAEKTARMNQAERDYQIRTEKLKSSWLASQRKKDQVKDDIALIQNYKIDRMINAVNSDDPVAFSKQKPQLAKDIRDWNQRVGKAKGYSKVAVNNSLISSPHAEPISNFDELATTDELLAGIDQCLNGPGDMN